MGSRVRVRRLAKTTAMPERDRKQLTKLAIVPAYNEEGMVGRVVREIKRQAPGFDVIVVDDGSVDSTALVAEREGATVLRQPFNLGIGGAMQAGYKYAAHHDYDVAVQVDGDGQHKPEYLPSMVEALQTSGGEADMVYGSRFLGDRLQGPLGPTARQPDLRGLALVDRPPEHHRPDLRAFGWSTATESSSSPATIPTTTPRSRRS